MFKKVLIANRGEVACRIMRTLRKMGIKSVAVYSDVDSRSLHVKNADEAIYIGPAPTRESYTNIKNIIDAIKTSNADGVHPGFGFLAENAEFAMALEDNGINFIAPDTNTIRLMGDKITAKRIAAESGVNIIPGYDGDIKDYQEAISVADSIGFPVILKAAAGGGGKGMRIVYAQNEMQQAFESATNEALKSFRDGRIFIEKYIENPRHIEIQILADKHDNVLCLGERECSIQRNHQKVIEEAPSPFVNDAMRQIMHDQCIALAQKVNYYSAGTVEFVVDRNRNFYFLEMNTRLQVEHPVTELVTGIDIVEQMIRIAMGERLSFSEVEITGSAIEARIYAENPAKYFMPSSGRITHYVEPRSIPGLRIDTGVYAGAEISAFYDPMIAKICTFSPDRSRSIELMRSALNAFVIRGITHNIAFLESIMRNSRFINSDISTRFIQDEYPDGFVMPAIQNEHVFIVIAAALCCKKYERTHKAVEIDGEMHYIFASMDDNYLSIEYKYRIFRICNIIYSGMIFECNLEGRPVVAQIYRDQHRYAIKYDGIEALCAVYEARVGELLQLLPKKASMLVNSNQITSPISGLVVKILVQIGDEVEIGQKLFIIEAMKMENSVIAEFSGKVAEILVDIGDSVAADSVLIRYV